MKYRYHCGLLISSNKITYVKCVKTDGEPSTEIVMDKKLLLINFNDGDTSSSVNNGLCTLIKDLPLVESEFELLPRAYMSGAWIVANSDIDNGVILQQYLVSSKESLTSGVVKHENSIVVVLSENDIKDLTIDTYVTFLNDSGLLYATPESTKFIPSNYWQVEFNDRVDTYKDDYLYGDEQNFAVEAPDYIAHLVDAIRMQFPTMDVFVSSGDRDTSKVEWLQMQTSLDQVSGDFHTIVYDNKKYGRWSHSTAVINFEYSTNDLTRCLARRNQYLHGKFLNEIRVVKFKVGDTVFAGSMFWDRSSITSDKPEESTTQDDAGYRLFSFTIQGTIYFGMAEYTDRKYPTILQVILKIMNTSYTVKLASDSEVT